VFHPETDEDRAIDFDHLGRRQMSDLSDEASPVQGPDLENENR